MSRRFSFLGIACAVGILASVSGCIVTTSPAPAPPPDTEIGIDPTLNFVSPTGTGCGAGLNDYTVTIAGGGPQSYACDQTALFTGLQAEAEYTFTIQGYATNGAMCWSGTCGISTHNGYGLTTYGDCSAELPFSCH